jgi:hypothetical protein
VGTGPVEDESTAKSEDEIRANDAVEGENTPKNTDAVKELILRRALRHGKSQVLRPCTMSRPMGS